MSDAVGPVHIEARSGGDWRPASQTEALVDSEARRSSFAPTFFLPDARSGSRIASQTCQFGDTLSRSAGDRHAA